MRFFLTYPQLPKGFDLEELALLQYERVFSMSRENFHYLISTELHADGEPHLHVYLEFKMVQKIYSQSKLDLIVGDRVYHGNYQAVKVKHNTVQYIIKSMDSLDKLNTNMELPIYKEQYYTNMEEHLYEVMLREGLGNALTLFYKLYPKEAVSQGSKVVRNLELAYRFDELKKESLTLPKFTIDQFNTLPPELQDWLDNNRNTTLLLWGSSGTGKTELAKALMHASDIPFIFIRERQGLRLFSKDIHGGIIFDDIDLDDFSREELIHLFDHENPSQIRVLYGSVTLPADLKKIFTTNQPNKFNLQDRAVLRRITPVHIKETSILANSSRIPLRNVIPASIVDSTPVIDTDNIKINDIEIQPKKSRGRPKGSKNKKL